MGALRGAGFALLTVFCLGSTGAEPVRDTRRDGAIAGLGYVADQLSLEAGHTRAFDAFDGETQADLDAFLATQGEAVRNSMAASVARLHVSLYRDAIGFAAPEYRTNLHTWYFCQYLALSPVKDRESALVSDLRRAVARGAFESAAPIRCQQAVSAAQSARAPAFVGTVESERENVFVAVNAAARDAAAACRAEPSACSKISLRQILLRLKWSLSFYGGRLRSAAVAMRADETATVRSVIPSLEMLDLVASDFVRRGPDAGESILGIADVAAFDDKASRTFVQSGGLRIKQLDPPSATNPFYSDGDLRASHPDSPAVAMLLLEDEPRCTATLVAPDLILTAAHCFCGVQPEDSCAASQEHDVKKRAFKAENWRVYFQHEGIVHVRGGAALADWLRIHDGYTTFPRHDLALVKLASPVRWIAPVKLMGAEQNVSANPRALSIGFGIHHSIADVSVGPGGIDTPPKGELAGIKIAGEVAVRSSCPNAPSGILCSEFKGALARAFDTGLCMGDSGGPLLWRSNWKDPREDIVQIGVASSLTHESGGDAFCSKGQYSNFTSIKENLGWLVPEIANFSAQSEGAPLGREQRLLPVLNATNRYRAAVYDLVSNLASKTIVIPAKLRSGHNIDRLTIGVNAAAPIFLRIFPPLGVAAPACAKALGNDTGDYAHAYVCTIVDAKIGDYIVSLTPKGDSPRSADAQIVATDLYYQDQ